MLRPLLIIPLLLMITTTSSADNVYKWVDNKGRVRFSTTPPNKNAKPAKLPPIIKREILADVPKLETCSVHGGVDCQAGADTDGSVICVDGFRNAAAIHRFTCLTAKVTIADIVQNKNNPFYTVILRNEKSVKAEGVSVYFVGMPGTKAKLSGETTIEPFGVAEYILTPPDTVQKMPPKLNVTQFEIDCLNCQ